MRERLIELIESRTCRNNFCQPNCTNCENVPLQDKEVERLADYLLKHGVIVPPCKVGDKVYIIDEPDFEDDYVLDLKVSEIGQNFRGMWIGLKLPLGMELSKYVFPNNLGKTVFLTKEEAENVLKERERV